MSAKSVVFLLAYWGNVLVAIANALAFLVADAPGRWFNLVGCVCNVGSWWLLGRVVRKVGA